MVATRLYEVTTKGTEWAYGRSSGRESPRPEAASIGSGMRSDPRPLSPFRPPPPRAQPPTALEGYWKYANNSLQYAAETTYSTLASFLSSIYCYNHDHSSRQRRQSLLGTVEPPLDDSSMREKRKTPFTKHLKTTDLVMIFKNPYDSVRGRHERPSSMSAVRSLLTLMPETTPSNRLQTPTLDTISPNDVLYEGLDNYDPEASFVLGKVRRKPFTVTPSETASQIAEGTLRALRDLALDEAVDLHIALRFWTERWERPILSWLEAGPESKFVGNKADCWIVLETDKPLQPSNSLDFIRGIQSPADRKESGANSNSLGTSVCRNRRVAATFVESRLAAWSCTVGRFGSGCPVGRHCWL